MLSDAQYNTTKNTANSKGKLLLHAQEKLETLTFILQLIVKYHRYRLFYRVLTCFAETWRIYITNYIIIKHNKNTDIIAKWYTYTVFVQYL